MSYAPDYHEVLDAARAARLQDEANAADYAPTLASICAAVRREVEAAERGRDLAAHVFDMGVAINRVAALAYRRP